MLKKLFDLLSRQERRRAVLLMGMILVMALLDMAGVASIMPFMAVLTKPELIETNAMLAAGYAALGFDDKQQFLLLLGVAVFFVLIISIVFKALTTYVQLRFGMMREYSIGRRLVEGYLHQPYIWFVNRHSADIGKTVLSEVQEVIGQALLPMLRLFAHGAVVLVMLLLLIITDAKLALSVCVVLGLAYGFISMAVKGVMLRVGRERVMANKSRFTAINEAFGAFKEVKTGNLESVFFHYFSKAAQNFSQCQAKAQMFSQVPRYVLEALTFGGMLLVVLYLMTRNSGNLSAVLPVITLYALASIRLMPALQQVYQSFTLLRYAGPALDSLHADLASLSPVVRAASDIAPMPLTQAIRLNSICFTYPAAKQPALHDLSLAIPVRSTIGLVGSTGSGKTTAIDVLLGLLEPDKGTLEVDGVVIQAGNRRSWQRAIGYVPQHIYLSDDTVAANIAFGVVPDKIDLAAVECAARIAKLHDFVVNELPQGYATTVGERGVRLSGGQRQRIGIARALYHKPQVLILDEATSALDNLTEQAVMDAVHHLGQEMTIIMIAHRLSTVRQCDLIYLLEQGRVSAQGSYDELVESNEMFQMMARGGEFTENAAKII